jgi:hypothetical protein
MTYPIVTANGPSGYNLTRSVRLRASASAYFNRTNASTTNQKTFTFSYWVKRGLLSSFQYLFGEGNGSNDSTLAFYSDDTFAFFLDDGTSNTGLRTTQVFRDPSAWYHFVVAMDTTQATASNRIKIYVNGSQITAFGTANYPSQNSNWQINSTSPMTIGRARGGSYFNGYMAEFNFIDGQQLTPSSFGSTNTLTGVWQPAPYTGSYGTNGFILDFEDNSALTTSSNVGLGKDTSGNGNYWTTNNISITAGVTYDSMTDVPTLTIATAANFAVMNPVTRPAGAGAAFVTSGGNLNCAVAYVGPDSTIAMSSGKWYWEVIPTSSTSSNNPRIGIVPSNHGTYSGTSVGDPAGTYGYASTGQKATGGTYTSYGSSFTDNDVIGVALDMTAGTIVFYKNGVSQGTAFTGLTGEFFASVGTGSSATMNLSFNFGQRPFAYTPPTGYVALNTYNLPTSTIVKGNTVMDATLYSGNNAATQTIVNAAGFQPDAVWLKSRSTVDGWGQVDSVRGVNKLLQSNNSNAESTTGSVTAFNSNGFTADLNWNVSGRTYVGYQWQAGQGTTSTNTSGSITSTVSVNASAGFSVVTFTGNGATSSGQTIGHGLGVTPAFIVTKKRSSGTTDYGWSSWHKDLGGNYGIWLNQTSGRNGSMWAGYTNINSSVFSPPDLNYCNESGQTYVAYLWSPIAGYSAFGSYTGNGSSDGVFVYTGFRAKFVLVKRTDTTADWVLYDTSRNPYNLTNLALFPNGNYAESTATVSIMDILSNGFKCRGTGAEVNASGGTYIYACFSENPFKNALAR